MMQKNKQNSGINEEGPLLKHEPTTLKSTKVYIAEFFKEGNSMAYRVVHFFFGGGEVQEREWRTEFEAFFGEVAMEKQSLWNGFVNL